MRDPNVDEYRQVLAEATGHGWGFLAAYGLTWLTCAVSWRRWGAQVGAYCTLFQGMLALPLALLLTAVTPGPDRPSMTGMDDLSLLLASGQLLGLPIVIHLVTRGRFTDVPRAMVILLVVHFAPYSWLYSTPLYLVMGAVVSIAAVVGETTARRHAGTTAEGDQAGAERVCLTTGVVMLVSAGVAWSI